jgi:HEAT repeat protein
MDFAFAFGGAQRREAGRLLRRLDAPAANARLLQVLEDESREPVWQVAIETLEEVNTPEAVDAAGATV